MIVDSFGRVHNYLRISLTDHCNLRCSYCMPEESYNFMPSSRLMQANEIEAISKVFVDSGVDKIRLTGGEPLLRHDFSDIIERLSRLPVSLSLTTNATRIHLYMADIKASRIRNINVSLDTLDRNKFKTITRRDHFEIVRSNIDLLLSEGINVKLNVVVMKGVNDDEIFDFVDWTKNTPIHVRFIEFMPFTGNGWSADRVLTAASMLDAIAARYQYAPIDHKKHDTARAYKINEHLGTVAFISTMSSHFCGDCNRIRLTADGKLKNCLFSKNETDLLSKIRNGEDIIETIHDTIHKKHKQLGGQFVDRPYEVVPESIQNRSMISIGG